MKRSTLLALIAAAAVMVTLCLNDLPAGGPKRSDSVVKVKAKLDKAPAGKAVVVVSLDIQKGWHLYANPVGHEDLESGQVTLKVLGLVNPKDVKIDYPAGKVVNDKVLGKHSIYEDKIEIRATFDHAAGPISISLKLQSCDHSTCLPPANLKISVP